MIRAVFQRRNSGLCGCTVKGHAGYAQNGQDIVCAAVSSAIMLTANLITEQLGEQAEVSSEDACVRIRLRQASGSGTLLLEGLLVHLQCLSEEYPGTIQISYSEV